jgi:hypothetical protein
LIREEKGGVCRLLVREEKNQEMRGERWTMQSPKTAATGTNST